MARGRGGGRTAVAFRFFGRFVLDFFGVSPAAVEFAGGLVIGCVLDS